MPDDKTPGANTNRVGKEEFIIRYTSQSCLRTTTLRYLNTLEN